MLGRHAVLTSGGLSDQPLQPFLLTKHAVHGLGNESAVVGAQVPMRPEKCVENAVGRVGTLENEVVNLDGVTNKGGFLHELHFDNF